MHEAYQEIAEFRIVYINEAHAVDSIYGTVPYAREKDIKHHENYSQRCSVAEIMAEEKTLTIPCIIDKMDNKANTAYQAFPSKLFLVRKDGKLAVAGERGPWGLKPAIKQAKEWLAKYKKEGQEQKTSQTP